MTKGSNFFNPQDGINKTQHIGVARASISYPSIFRQMAETLATDDSISSFSVIDIIRDQNAIFFKVEVTTRLGEFLQQNIEITG